jgi:two-component system LytT family response regulator
VRQYHLDTQSYPIVTEDGVVMCRSEALMGVEATHRQVLVYTTQGTFLSKDPMEHWKATLTLPCFYQTHRSYLVNMRFVHRIHRDRVVLCHGQQQWEAYLTRRRYSAFKDQFLQYIERIQ